MSNRLELYKAKIRRGLTTKEDSIQAILTKLKHHANILANVKVDGSFRYGTIVDHFNEVKGYYETFKALSDWQPDKDEKLVKMISPEVYNKRLDIIERFKERTQDYLESSNHSYEVTEKGFKVTQIKGYINMDNLIAQTEMFCGEVRMCVDIREFKFDSYPYENAVEIICP